MLSSSRSQPPGACIPGRAPDSRRASPVPPRTGVAPCAGDGDDNALGALLMSCRHSYAAASARRRALVDRLHFWVDLRAQIFRLLCRDLFPRGAVSAARVEEIMHAPAVADAQAERTYAVHLPALVLLRTSRGE